VRVTPETRFAVASVTKAFTGVALLKLCEAGRIDLDAPIQRYVPSFPPKQGGKITLRLLAAQAGRAGGSLVANLAPRLDSNRLNHWMKVLTNNPPAMEEPLSFWRALHPTNQNEAQTIGSLWKETASKYAQEERERADFNRTNFIAYADFRSGSFAQWRAEGQGLQDQEVQLLGGHASPIDVDRR
jgi:hypothetical protein